MSESENVCVYMVLIYVQRKSSREDDKEFEEQEKDAYLNVTTYTCLLIPYYDLLSWKTVRHE